MYIYGINKIVKCFRQDLLLLYLIEIRPKKKGTKEEKKQDFDISEQTQCTTCEKEIF